MPPNWVRFTHQSEREEDQFTGSCSLIQLDSAISLLFGATLCVSAAVLDNLAPTLLAEGSSNLGTGYFKLRPAKGIMGRRATRRWRGSHITRGGPNFLAARSSDLVGRRSPIRESRARSAVASSVSPPSAHFMPTDALSSLRVLQKLTGSMAIFLLTRL